MEEKRERLAAAKREAIAILGLLDAPGAAVELIAEIFGGWDAFHARRPGEHIVDHGGIRRDENAFDAAARIEASRPVAVPNAATPCLADHLSTLSARALSREIGARLGTTTDYQRQVREWRAREDYQRLVWRLRDTDGPGSGPSTNLAPPYKGEHPMRG